MVWNFLASTFESDSFSITWLKNMKYIKNELFLAFEILCSTLAQFVDIWKALMILKSQLSAYGSFANIISL